MNKLVKINGIVSKAKQKGVVLIVSLVFLTALTAVAAALMQDSTTDMKMAGASEDKAIAVQDAISAVDEVIDTQRLTGFTRPLHGDNFPIVNALPANPVTGASATVAVANNDYNLEIDCPHSKLPSSAGSFRCGSLRVQVTRDYGRKGNSQINVSSGVAQTLIGGN